MTRPKILCIFLLFLLIGTAFPSKVSAQFNFLQGKKKIEAEPNKEYTLKESDGLWFVMAKNFQGETSKEKANELALEFRKKYKMQAYIFKLDPEKSDLEDLAQRNRSMKKYKYNTERVTEYGVLIGSFSSVDDPNLQQTLLTIRRSKPDCLNKDPMTKVLIDRFAAMSKKNPQYAGFGPLGGAIAVPNPLIDKDFYSQKGVVDPFIEKINSDVKFSLLNNPKMYTLRVATFSGDISWKKLNEKDKGLHSKLRFAGLKAAALCEALRQKGVEAWEFHDRDSSFVTIGGFDSYGTPRADGYIELNPEIDKLMQKYQGVAAPGMNGAFNTKIVTVEMADPTLGGKKHRVDIPFDINPIIITVPQKQENMQKAIAAKKRREEELKLVEMRKDEKALVSNASERNFRKNIRHQAVEKAKVIDSQLVADQQPENQQLAADQQTVNLQATKQQTVNNQSVVNQQVMYPVANQVGQANGYPVTNQVGQTNGYPVTNQVGQANGYPAANQVGQANGYPAATQVGQANGYPVTNQVGQANGYPVTNQVGQANGYPAATQVGQANGYPAATQVGQANGYPAATQVGQANGYPAAIQVGQANGYPTATQVGQTNGYPATNQVGQTNGYPATNQVGQTGTNPAVPGERIAMNPTATAQNQQSIQQNSQNQQYPVQQMSQQQQIPTSQAPVY